MDTRGSARTVVGIDVGAHVFDIVVLGRLGVPLVARSETLRDLTALLDALHPALVAIDSPARRARPGSKSRAAERALNDAGIRCFFTPDRVRNIPFYDWVRQGFRVHEAARARRRRIIEVYPHASAVVLARRLPRNESKSSFRRRALRDQGIDVTLLRTQDQVDAALAALTGVRVLEGRAHPVGGGAEGRIWLPARPRGRYT